MCLKCQPLIKAIDRYLQKADDDLEEELEDSGRVSPKETVDAINEIEEAVSAALVSETEYFIKKIKKKKTISEVIDALEEIKAKDTYCDEIRKAVSEQLHKLVPKLVKQYVAVVDSEIEIKAISKKAYDCIDSWSSELADIMKLNSHKAIEKILKDGLDVGSSIPDVVLEIENSGIRNEYYRARATAVTEILNAHNMAKQEAAMQNPCITYKLWRHTGAHKNQPRENHVEIDGQKVQVSEPYILAGADGNIYYPMYPTDAILPPEERINCHCLSQDIVDDDILNLPLEERQELQRKALEDMDDEWERELDAQNKAKAGIE